MKTNIRFFENETHQPSDCGDSLDIEISNKMLGWEGILVEKGMAPNFYFALDIGHELHWQAEKNGALMRLKSTAGNIWMNPPGSSFTHVVNEPCYFIVLTITENVLFSPFDGSVKQEALQFLNQIHSKNFMISHPKSTGTLDLWSPTKPPIIG